MLCTLPRSHLKRARVCKEAKEAARHSQGERLGSQPLGERHLHPLGGALAWCSIYRCHGICDAPFCLLDENCKAFCFLSRTANSMADSRYKGGPEAAAADAAKLKGAGRGAGWLAAQGVVRLSVCRPVLSTPRGLLRAVASERPASWRTLTRAVCAAPRV